jgi:hypothetical protein
MTGDPVSLGMGAAWGFSGSDTTSPAQAANAAAIPDTLPVPMQQGGGARWRATELRVHGVSGSDGPTMLEHPGALQVAGDSITMFYRRWTPADAGGNSVPWKLEAYSWGGLTEAPLAAASWILLAPFMMFNLGQFMLPPTRNRHEETGPDGDTKRVSRDRWHAVAVALLRLLAVTATVQFVLAAVTVLVNVLAYQGRQAHMPSWLGAYTQRSADVRVAIATVAVIGVVAVMWWISVKTANRYEARVSAAEQEFDEACPLTQPSFWAGEKLVGRQRCLHAAAALAVVAMVVARPVEPFTGFRVLVLVVASVTLLAVAASVLTNLVDRHAVVLGRKTMPAAQALGRKSRARADAGTWWCRAVLGVAGVALVASVFTGGWQDPKEVTPRTVPGMNAVCAALLGTQAVSLVALAAVVAVCVRKARPDRSDPDWRPFLRGHLTTVIVALGLSLGSLVSLLTALFVTRLIGAPVPSGLLPSPAPSHALEIPWPMYAFAAAPIGLLLAGAFAVAWLLVRWRGEVTSFVRTKVDADGRTVPSKVGAYYGVDHGDPDSHPYVQSRRRVARAWATARLTDKVPAVALLLTLGMIVAVILAVVVAWQSTALSPVVHGVASAETAVGLLVAGLLVGMLRSAYKDPSNRRTIGALWDVGTFWPRAVHPFAPPCYAERAVPELVDRVRLLTGTVAANDDTDPAWLSILAHRRDSDRVKRLEVAPGPVLLTGYSQGAIIGPAVIAQLPAETIDHVALLTLACPARRLYGRAFPAYFGSAALAVLADRLTDNATEERPAGWPERFDDTRWRTLVRKTDYIGSWVHAPEKPNLSPDNEAAALDQPCWDPPVLSADAYPTPAPIHRHSDFWQDPRTTELAGYLIDKLPAEVTPGSTQAAPADAVAGTAEAQVIAALLMHVETLHAAFAGDSAPSEPDPAGT